MGQENVALVAFNRGLISPLGLARIDSKRTALSAEVFTNWMPRVLGSMMLRPGLEYLSGTKSNKLSYHIPFIFSRTDKAIIEMTDLVMRIRIDDVILTRVSVSTAVTSGDFSSATGWTDADESGATSTITGGKLELTGTRFAAAIRKQQVTVAGGDLNKEHALRIVVDRGPVTLRVGSSDGADDYVTETNLGTGTHSLAFTPTGDFWIQFSSLAQAKKIVDSCTVESAGSVEISTPYVESDLRKIRYDQSADIIYLACSGYQHRKIERRGTGRSWSLVIYEPEDGPFRVINTTTTSLTPSALTGDITLTASRKLFKSTNVGSLFKITSIGQKVTAAISGIDQWSDYIKVIGIGSSQRSFNIVIANIGTNTVTLQRSVGEPGAWIDVTTYTSNGTVSYNDGLDNQTIYYRIGIKAAGYVGGTTDVELNYANGGLTGIVRVTGYTSETQVSAAVLTALGGTSGSSDWYEGEWSDRRGYTSACALHDGRLWWGGKSKIHASVSDAYESFDDDLEGDSKPINRSIGQGPVDHVNWLVSLSRLLIGTDGQEGSIRSNSLDEPVTFENITMKFPSTQGSSDVGAVKVDDTAPFVDKSGTSLYVMSNNSNDVSYGYGDYVARSMCEMVPEIGQSGILRLSVQRKPDTRIHCLLGDGKVAVLVSQPLEETTCWVLVETDGTIEDIVVLPGSVEDEVYYQVARTVNGSTVRYLEKWALESECQGGTLNKQADSFILYSGASATVLTGLGHLEGCSVVVWGNGMDLGTYTVASGSITVSQAVTQAVIGLKYEAQFKSSKLAYAADGGTALTIKKKADKLGVILRNTHYQGLKYGRTLTLADMDDLPLVEDEETTAEHTIWEDYDTDVFEFPGDTDSDARLCLYACAPRPCTVLAAVIGIKTNG